MGDFKPRNSAGRFGGRPSGNSGGRGGFGGERRGGSGFGGRPRDNKFGRGDRKSFTMHEATCSNCGKSCQVPFKPTGSKPVFCSDCFRQQEQSGAPASNRSFGMKDDRPRQVQSGISPEQFNQLNKKLDKILSVLQDLELDVGEESEEELEEESDSESE